MIEVGPSDADLAREERRLRQEKLRAILDVAQAVDRLSPLPKVDVWIDLGYMLYALGDSAGSIVAYNNALRPVGERAASQSGALNLRQIQGNLARAYAHEGHYDRAEWLLRQCVFKPDGAFSNGKLTQQNVFDRLDLDHLRERPTDASELTYALSRRAERLREAGHFTQAYQALQEARYLLEPVLGVSPDSAHNHDLFTGSYAARPVGRQWRRGATSIPLAYAFNFLGKCYRLSCSLALDSDRLDVNPTYFLKGAVRHLRQASQIDPNLPYPWAHRLALQAERRLRAEDRKRVLEEVVKDLTAHLEPPELVRVIDGLLEREQLSDEAREALRTIKHPVA